jgi:succinate-acetate transporter protein
MLSMILQIGGLANLITGITTAALSDSFDAESKKGKFDFWYQ